MTVKELLEDYFLIPRKIRHFLRTKKHVLVNGETINWQSPVQKGDQIQLIFDADDYPEKELLEGDPSLVEELYQDEHVIIVNKPEGMKPMPTNRVKLLFSTMFPAMLDPPATSCTA